MREGRSKSTAENENDDEVVVDDDDDDEEEEVDAAVAVGWGKMEEMRWCWLRLDGKSTRESIESVSFRGDESDSGVAASMVKIN